MTGGDRAALDWYDEQQIGLGAALVAEIDLVIDGLREGTIRGVGVPGVREDLRIRRAILKRFPYDVICIEQGDVSTSSRSLTTNADPDTGASGPAGSEATPTIVTVGASTTK